VDKEERPFWELHSFFVVNVEIRSFILLHTVAVNSAGNDVAFGILVAA
jgi:hypothetical protein